MSEKNENPYSGILKRKVLPYSLAGIFLALVCSMGVVFAIGSNEMSISGQAYMVAQATGDKLPLYPVPNPNDPTQYFYFRTSGNQQVGMIEQKYEGGDFYLSVCGNNSTTSTVTLYFYYYYMNPTAYVWTQGKMVHAEWPVADGGLANVNFSILTFISAAPTLTTNQTTNMMVYFSLAMGNPATQGSRIFTLTYTVNGRTLNSQLFIKYYPRTAAECPL